MKTIRAVVLLSLLAVVSVRANQAPHFFRIKGPVTTRITSFTAAGNVTWTNAATNATFTIQIAYSLVGPGNWFDLLQVPVTNRTNSISIYATTTNGMVLIPPGPFVMGDNLDGESIALPVHTNTISAFYVDQNVVSKSLWDNVYQWATNHGYSFDNPGDGKAPNHPVQGINWYDALKWCNARSEMEGRTPAYYMDPGQTNVYRNGQLSLDSSSVNWNAGYRLPTEAEWEKAARGGTDGQRFPWGASISWSQANYYASSFYSYDTNSVAGYDAAFNDGVYPYTSPVGSFPPNGYGVYDTQGNTAQWCWDRYGPYSSASQTDPRGPVSGSYRLIRGGGYDGDAFSCRVADRYNYAPPDFDADDTGFRCVRAPSL